MMQVLLAVSLLCFTTSAVAQSCTNDTNAVIIAVYQSLLQRAPDAGGLQTWTTVLNDNNVKEVVRGVMKSAEWKSRHGPDANSQITVAYNELLSRPPDPPGLNNWLQVYQSKGMDAVVDGIVDSSGIRVQSR